MKISTLMITLSVVAIFCLVVLCLEASGVDTISMMTEFLKDVSGLILSIDWQ